MLLDLMHQVTGGEVSRKLSVERGAQVVKNLCLRRNWEVIDELQFLIDFSVHCRLGSAKTGSPYTIGKSSENTERFWRKVFNALWFSGKR